MRSGRTCIVVPVVVGLLAIAAFPAAAVGSWSPPATVSADATATDPHVGLDADGDAVFAWVRSDGSNFRIRARTRSSAGTLGPVLNLSAAGQDASGPVVAVDPAGDAVFAWIRFDGANWRVQARALSAAGVLGPVQTLSRAGESAGAGRIAIDDAGDSLVAWNVGPGGSLRIKARARSAAGALSAIQDIAGPSSSLSGPSGLAMDPAGNAVVVFDDSDGSNLRVQTRARSAAGVLGPIQNLSPAGADAVGGTADMDAAGAAVFAWRRQTSASNSRIQTRTRSAAGSLNAVQSLSDLGFSSAAEVGVDPDGDAVFAWMRDEGATAHSVQARGRSADGTLGTIRTLSGTGDDAVIPHVAVDARANPVFSWRLIEPSPVTFRAQATQALSPVTTLTPPGIDAGIPQIASNAAGDAAVVWDLEGTGIQAAFGP